MTVRSAMIWIPAFAGMSGKSSEARSMSPSISSLAAGLAALALAVPAIAQTASGDPAAVKAGAYRVEPQHTRVLFAVSHMGFTTYYGDFTGVSGQLTLDPGAPGASRVSV